MSGRLWRLRFFAEMAHAGREGDQDAGWSVPSMHDRSCKRSIALDESAAGPHRC